MKMTTLCITCTCDMDENMQNIRLIKDKKFGHVNIETLLGHFTDIGILIERNMFDVFSVSETKLDDTISDEKICPVNYFCHRKDRNLEGGRVAVYVSNVIPHKHRRDLEEDNIQMLCI